ncbi:hypothetical protein BV372_30305 [Nostoc sp. T09]|uniref:HEAT repeat domain-containing protein n=1 Tax=Nostoc sp. T09 TaxID=1932621 RepID=UPI000A3715C6|nr:hypothetical protein BV372_30305 [Nostoc sp. T09]
MNEPDSSVLTRAANALREIKDSQTVAPLIQALHDPDSWVRRIVANVLREICSSEILPEMCKLRLTESETGCC